jgi:GNAT superfamily N-acetyltransferase
VKPSISLAVAGDASALAALREVVARDMAQRFGEGPWSQSSDLAEIVLQLNASRVLVARQDDGIVGTVRLAKAIPWAIDASAFTKVSSALYVLGLAVAPHLHVQGIGRCLMDEAKQIVRAGSAEALWLDAYEHAAGAGPFYLKCGFRAVGRTLHREMPLMYYEWLP